MSQPTCGNPLGFSRQEIFIGDLPLSASVTDPGLPWWFPSKYQSGSVLINFQVLTRMG